MQHSEHLLTTRDLPELPSGKRGFLGGLLRSPARKQIDAALKDYAEARASYAKLSEQNNKVSSAYDSASITDNPAKAREPYLELRTRLDAALTTAEKAFDSVSDAITARDANRRGAGVDRSLDAKVDAARDAMQAARQQFTAGQAMIDPPLRRQPERAARQDTFGTGTVPVPRTPEVSAVTRHNTFPHRNSLDISKLPRRRADSPPRADSPGPSPKSRGIRR